MGEPAPLLTGRQFVSLPAAITGLLLIVASTDLGRWAAESLLRSKREINSAQFPILLESYIASFRLIGALLLAVGLWCVLEPPSGAHSEE